jgi:hypothetical protein
VIHKDQLIAELASLQDKSLEALRIRWAKLFKLEPGPWISRDLLIRGLAWKVQEEMFGGLEKGASRRLAQLAAELDDHGSIKPAQAYPFKPGTRLVREWQGRVHEVVITEGGFIWSGRAYSSLSQVARLITGTRWSGPRFFGLAGAGGRADPAPTPGLPRSRETASGSPLAGRP